MALAIALATRGRPEILLETIATTLANVERADTRLFIAVDDDDELTISALDAAELSGRVTVSIAPREDSLGAKYNRIWRLVPSYDAYLVMVDYAPHITPGFDAKLLKAAEVFPDGIGVVYGPLVCQSLPAINCVTRGLVELMEGIYPEFFPFSLVDLWLDSIAQGIGRVAYAEVEIDRSKRSPTMGWRDIPFWTVYYDQLWPEREKIIEHVIKAMHGPLWLKNLLRQRMPQWKQRDEIYNALCRWQKTRQDTTDDARYQRIYNEAIAKGAKPVHAVGTRQMVVGIGMVSGDMKHAITEHCMRQMKDRLHGSTNLIIGEMPALGSVITQNQNTIFSVAVKEQMDYLLLVDSDMVFPPDTLERLLAHQKPIVGAVYRARQPPYIVVGRPLEPAIDIRTTTGIVECDHIPSGLMLIHCDVLRAMGYPWSEEIYDPPRRDALLRLTMAARQALIDGAGEILEKALEEYDACPPASQAGYIMHDVWFCRKAKQLGFSTWADLDLSREVGHLATIPLTLESRFSNEAA